MDGCIVCGAMPVIDSKGYLFCLEHQHLRKVSLKALDSVVALKFQGKSPKEIEKYLEGLI